MDSEKASVWMFGGIASKTGYANGCPTIKVCSDGVLLNELWHYNISADQWTLTQYGNSSVLPEARHSAVICGESDNIMVMFGGYGSQNEALSDTWIFDLRDKIWQKKIYQDNGECGKQPLHRAAMLHWCTRDSLWILGGIGQEDTILNDMWRFTFSDGCWSPQSAATNSLMKQKLNSTTPVALQPDSPTWLLRDTELVFLSNISANAGETLSNQSCKLWTMSTENLEWKPVKLKTELPKTSVSHENTYVKFQGESPPCRISAASWVDSSYNLWLFGGHRHIPRFINRTSVYVCDIWVLETPNNTWIQWFQKKYSKVQKYLFQTVPSHLNLPEPRAHAMSWFFNGTMYLFGGESQNDDNISVKYLNDFWRWHMGHPTEAQRELLLPPTGVFFVTLGALCFLAICVFGIIFVAKASSPQAPRLKPPTHNGKIKYSPVSTTEDVLFES